MNHVNINNMIISMALYHGTKYDISNLNPVKSHETSVVCRRVVRSSLLECCQQGAFPGGELVLAFFLGGKKQLDIYPLVNKHRP